MHNQQLNSGLIMEFSFVQHRMMLLRHYLPIVQSCTSIPFKIFTIWIRSEDYRPSYEKSYWFARVTQDLKVAKLISTNQNTRKKNKKSTVYCTSTTYLRRIERIFLADETQGTSRISSHQSFSKALHHLSQKENIFETICMHERQR